MGKIAYCAILLSSLLSGFLSAQISGGDLLNEAPIYRLPAGMNFEEYRDANRRIGIGMMLMSIPIPGTLHFYANEDMKGWLCVGAAGLGLVSIATGALLAGEEKWQESDYDIVVIDGNRFEKIPISMEGDLITYSLRKQEKERELSTGGAILLGLGAVSIIGEIIYDWLDGIGTIEYKRDAVRYKYGISGEWGAKITPKIGKDGSPGLALIIE